MRRSLLFLAAAAALAVVPASRAHEAPMEWAAGRDAGAALSADAGGGDFGGEADRPALEEMLRGSKGRLQRWTRPPALTVVTSVLEYQRGDGTTYTATTEPLTSEAADGLVADLTAALALLTDNTYAQFAAVHLEPVQPGTTVDVSRTGQIVVGRYRGVRSQLDTIGFGGRSARPDGMITRGAIVLDNDFDRTSELRRLLRTHELGHALGYNHVTSTTSIMNPRIGSEPTEFDRKAARLAFQALPAPLTSRR